MSEQQIKFMVNRIYAKDISLESPESPKIFNELKLQPKVGFNLNTSIEKIEENTFEGTLNISIKAEAEETKKMLELGIIEPSRSEWSANVVMVKKKATMITMIMKATMTTMITVTEEVEQNLTWN